MFKLGLYGKRNILMFSGFLFILVGWNPALAVDAPEGTTGIWDSSRYISLAEVKPGMEAYCLTEYGRAGIEKFELEVIDVVRDFDPGRDVILVKGLDERFIHTGAVAGCSGSPVYIDGRLAGALAYGWQFGKDALYGATAIEDMLQIGLAEVGEKKPAFVFDFNKPIILSEIEKQASMVRTSKDHNLMGARTLPCPLVASGLSAEACDRLQAAVEPLGIWVVPGSTSIKTAAGQEGGGQTDEAEQKLMPGSCLAVPLVSGDIVLGTYGTVTEVRDSKIYGFGHPFLGYGPVDMPMATGTVHTVVSSAMRSFKLCSVGRVVGVLTTDEGAGIMGRVGGKAKTIPLTISVDRFNDARKRTYNCTIAINEELTPTLITSAISGAVFYLGELPQDHTIEYEGSIGIKGYEPLTFKNVSASRGINDLAIDAMSSVRLLLNNPYKQADLTSIDLDIRIKPNSIVSQIWSVDLSDSKVKAGDRIMITTVVETVRSGKKKYEMPLDIPEDLKPGRYELAVCGSQDYEQFLVKAVPYRFVAPNFDDLVKTLRVALDIDRSKLYFLLALPSGGIAVEKAELPDLPGTKSLVLQSATRVTSVRPYPHWLEKSLDTGTVTADRKVMRITVEN